MFEKEWLPDALSIGISYNDFWDMNPHVVKIISEGHKKRMQMIDEQMWTMGLYIMSALDATVCNSDLWRKKHEKPHKYVEKPILQGYKGGEQTEISEEKRKEMENYKLAMSLKIAKVNWDLKESRKKKLRDDSVS